MVQIISTESQTLDSCLLVASVTKQFSFVPQPSLEISVTVWDVVGTLAAGGVRHPPIMMQ